MKKMSKRTKRMLSSEAYTAKVFTSRFNGLAKILTVLAKGSEVVANERSVYRLASMKQLF